MASSVRQGLPLPPVTMPPSSAPLFVARAAKSPPPFTASIMSRAAPALFSVASLMHRCPVDAGAADDLLAFVRELWEEDPEN